MESPREAHISAHSDTSEASYVVEPTVPHSHTVILLHGLGSNGLKFGKELVETAITADAVPLPQVLPGARFIFPTAERRRSSAFKRAQLTQWFDIARLDDPDYRKDTQLKGLSESYQQLRPLIDTEVRKVGAKNVILGGISNGAAMAMSILLALELPLGGFIGLCSYLPWQKDILEAISSTSGAGDELDDDDPFRTDEDQEHKTAAVKSVEFERDLLGLIPLENCLPESTASKTPVFLGHGEADDKKPSTCGLAAAETLRSAEYKVSWKLYPDLGHWYKIPDEIDDIVAFIKNEVGWTLHEPAEISKASHILTVTQAELEAAYSFGKFVPVYKVNDSTVVKSGKTIRMSEAATMRYVREHTTIPVPEVYNAYYDEESKHTRIIMEYIDGVELEGVWDTYDDPQRQSIIEQLRGYMEQLRTLKSERIGTVDDACCDDHYFDYTRDDENDNKLSEDGRAGPFASEAAFNQGIVDALQHENDFTNVDYICDVWRDVMTDHDIVLTHNDFSPRNILVKDAKVVAIIDWELSGFFPDYWEYCKALRRPDWESNWVKDKVLDKIIKPYRKELAVIWSTIEYIW